MLNEQINREVENMRSRDVVVQYYQIPTDKIEISAFIGLSFLTAVLKEKKLYIKDMFSEEFGRGFYRATFTWNRFIFVLSALRFDDSYEPSSHYTVDE